MFLTDFDNINTTYCFSCKQRIGNLGELFALLVQNLKQGICAGIRDWTGLRVSTFAQ